MRDRRYDWLERAYRDPDASLFWLHVMAAYDLVRSDPRFEQMVRRIGWPWYHEVHAISFRVAPPSQMIALPGLPPPPVLSRIYLRKPPTDEPTGASRAKWKFWFSGITLHSRGTSGAFGGGKGISQHSWPFKGAGF